MDLFGNVFEAVTGETRLSHTIIGEPSSSDKVALEKRTDEWGRGNGHGTVKKGNRGVKSWSSKGVLALQQQEKGKE